jgi:Zn-dependent protease with chaperone function
VSAVAATFFDGRTSRAYPVQLAADGSGVLAIRAGDWERNELLTGIRVTPRVAGIHRTLVLRDGGQLQVEDNNAVDAWFPNRDRTAALIDRLERHYVAVATSLLVTAASIVFVTFFGIPYAAEKIAANIPPSVAREMGEQTVTLLNRFGIESSKLPQKRRDELQAVFTKYVADLPDPKHYQLRFMDAKHPNAFALPGGIIVVTDEMVRLIDTKTDGVEEKNAGKDESAAKDDDDGDDEDEDDEATADEIAKVSDEAKSKDAAKSEEKAKGDAKVEDHVGDERFLAVAAHEIGHEEHRHVLRSVLQSSAVVLIGAYFTGDVNSASALVVSVPTFLLDGHYSRDFEAEADSYAFESLAKHGISPGRFAEVMQAMQKADPHIRHESGYLSTHPPTVDRIVKAREAAERFGRGRDDAVR